MKVDEDLPQHVVGRLQASGYEAVHVLDQSMGGWKDPELWSAIQREGFFLITGDKGFGDVRVYPPETHAGVLVLRPQQDGIRPLLELTDAVLRQWRLEDLAGAVSVATPAGIRTRRARPLA